MNTMDIARKMASLGQKQDAVRAYTLSLRNEQNAPEQQLEAASYILQAGGDHRIPFTYFRNLYNEGHFQEQIFPMMHHAFYEPNLRAMRNRYDRNCKALERYPYFFHQEPFVPFEELDIQFFPYNGDHGYVPFYVDENRFGNYVNTREPAITRNFFKDLEKPILAKEVYSQYELEYLSDNVRKSEYIGRENHIYLHYADWKTFCAWLQVLNLRSLLEDQKVVFLIGDEIAQYPIDFNERFGIDYSQFPVQPIHVSEVQRLIWHTQLSTHNGGDFFNEIFDAHPNLLAMPSLMFDNIEETLLDMRTAIAQANSFQDAQKSFKDWKDPRVVQELYQMRTPSDKDLLVAFFLGQQDYLNTVDLSSRMVPALFFQPHFHNIVFDVHVDRAGRAVLHSDEYEKIRRSPIFLDFKYIKTFTPMRRFTTSHGATVKFMYQSALKTQEDDKSVGVVSDAVSERILNRSFMRNPQDRLYYDSVVVRFEDGKLNPKATFTALAAFLDLPYTESMTYCSLKGELDPESLEGNDLGFSLAALYRTYDDYVNDSERYYIECFLRDAYQYYGYDFHYYDNQPIEKDKIKPLVDNFTTIDHYIRATWTKYYERVTVQQNDGKEVSPETAKAIHEKMLEEKIKGFHANRERNADILSRGLYFVNRNNQPLRMIPKLQLDPALLEQPLYH